jgi:antibiotic biosynthesis monooxygenase (ABM) superfamily enzyme
MRPHHDARAPSSNSDGPVTVIVTRRAKKGKIKEFEEWMDGIIHEVMKFEGHMGSNIIRPTDELTNPEYVIIFRFSTYENLAKWERSEIRKEWLEKSMKVTEGEAVIEKQTGLEFWFTPRSGRPDKTHELPIVTPPRYKMAIVVTAIIFVLVSIMLPQVQQATRSLPGVLSTLIGVVIMVLLMTYVIMPAVTRVLKPWLSRQRLF